MTSTIPELLTRAEAARLARVSVLTLDRARKRGAIGFHRIGSRVLFTGDQILAFLEATERAPFRPAPRKTSTR